MSLVSIRNKTLQWLHLNRIGKAIGPAAELEVTEEEAQALAGHRLLDGVPPAPEPTPDIPHSGYTPAAATSTNEGAQQ